MILYVMEVEATPGAAVRVGQRVRRGQKIGMARDAHTEVVSPADGVVRTVEFNRYENHYTVNVISQGREPVGQPCAA